ncbi:MAG: hypothetical protein MUF13_04225 [Akkermansiaceae bacterium]|nr:hypothetical protein [Akkermansiaceae bacterium]
MKLQADLIHRSQCFAPALLPADCRASHHERDFHNPPESAKSGDLSGQEPLRVPSGLVGPLALQSA